MDPISTDQSARRPAAGTLGLRVDDMRRLGYRMVDLVVDRMTRRRDEPAIRTGTPADLFRRLGGPVPEQPGDADTALDLLVSVALSHQQNGDHPRYFARVPGPSSFTGILGDWISTGFNSMAASWAGGSGPATVELVVIDWLRDLLGFPEGTEGVFVSGGSLANLTALAAIRAARGPGVAYMSDQTHASLVRDLLALGFNDDQVRVLPADDGFGLPVADVEAAILADRAAGREPLVVIGTAGTTNTGTVDPLNGLAELCEQQDLWFHVDGAYGAPAAMTETGRAALAGMDRAHSLVLDPHKWLFQPYDAGIVLMRQPSILSDAFAITPEYLKDVKAAAGEVDFRDRGLELTRRARALKLWLTFRIHGAARIRAAVQHGITLAEVAEAQLRAHPEKWEVVSPAQLGIVCFALRDADPAEHEQRAAALADSGYACVSTTVLKGRTVFRLCIINPLTNEEDIHGTLDRLSGAGS